MNSLPKKTRLQENHLGISELHDECPPVSSRERAGLARSPEGPLIHSVSSLRGTLATMKSEATI